MSGSAIPYHLRPHKSVDRRLFLDLLTRFERWNPLSEYVYISMGAYPLEDHKLIYRIIGVTKLISFDLDEQVVARQSFNKPSDTCFCLHKKSGDIIADLDNIIADCKFTGTPGIIFWLDYTKPAKIGEQIREFEALLNRLRSGDVVRVTVNANPQALGPAVDAEGKPIPKAELRSQRFRKLKQRLNDYLPSWASEEHVGEEDLPRVLAGAFATAALNAFPATGPSTFQPLSIVRYADGQQMLSITGAVVRRGEESLLQDRMDLPKWPFSSATWETVHRLVVPALTVRERLFLERGIVGKEAPALISELGFADAAGVEMKEFLASYKDYYRFYPSLLTAEI
jgi:hypothetical protein